MSNQTTSGYRTQAQVSEDLRRALHFSPESLEANRNGRLSVEQFKYFLSNLARPAVMTVVWLAAPFLVWAGIISVRKHEGFTAALGIFIGHLTHINDLIENEGKIGALSELGSLLASVVMALYTLSKISLALYFDLLDRKVTKKEFRVMAREEQTMRANGRDPIEKYYFAMKTASHPVSYEAYKALESGAVYLVYFLPRTDMMVSIEPKTF